MASSDILAKLEEILERQANIEAKLDAMMEGQPEREPTTSAPKRTRAPATDRVPCTYMKKNGKPCEKPSRPDTEYCAEHPEGMTRAAYKKKTEGTSATTTSSSSKKETTEPAKMSGPRLTYEKDEANNIQIIKTPAIFKNIVISLEQPYKAYFMRLSDENARPLTTTEIKQLEKSNIVLAPEDEQNDMLEQLNLTLNKQTPKATTKIQLSSDSEDDEPIKPKGKVETKKTEPKSKVEPKVDVEAKSDSESEVKPAPKGKTRVEAKKPKSDSDSSDESEDERPKPSTRNARRNVSVNDDSD